MITIKDFEQFQLQASNHDQKNIIKQYKCESWESHYYKSILRKFKIVLNKDNEIQYFVDGQLLRIKQEKSYDIELEVWTNLEQIKNLEWLGSYGQNNQKVGKWKATWIGETLHNVGGWYFNDGKKQGLWKELTNNYQSQAQVYEFGEYFNGLRQNNWVYLQQQKKIGGGKYNLKGQKNGKWIELIDGFQNNTQVIYTGEYKYGKKVGLWDILYKKYDNLAEQYFGGGLYDKECNGMKIGKWIDLDEKFFNGRQVIHQGEYKNGNKVGKWVILFDWIRTKQMGGGLYDQECNGMKIGNWIDLDKGFYNGKQVTHQGEYKTGKKIGGWDIWYRDHNTGRDKQIGGGSYDQSGFETKIGKWIDLDKRFYYDGQITYNGEYKDGKKVGRWDIYFFNKQMQKILQKKKICVSGGGLYDERGFETKIGKWIDLDESFSLANELTYKGEYQNGKKFGRWDIWFKDCQNERNYLIGGGSYDKRCDDIKIGKWIELDNKFNYQNQLIQKGEYNHSKKIGRWDICLIQKGLIFGLNYELMYSIFQTYQNLLVEVDHMMKEVMVLKVGNGLIWMTSFIDLNLLLEKQLQMGIIKMVKKLEGGIFGSRFGIKKKKKRCIDILQKCFAHVYQWRWIIR
ncbi:unnamed protein product [Paramecium primaurelia]|uniref:Uncharacterized protein n=1 Tax=Paramecium primaurelia TaxID=5886 RepID=A0A8S1KR85_PARPR|nr:unnamed protein product [Paramecium primaurelia]